MAVRKLYIVGEISWEAYKEFSEGLTKLESENVKPIQVELASDGGDSQAALAFSSRIRLCNAEIVITAYGNVASAATLILASGDQRIMTREAWVMVHEGNSDMADLSLAEKERELKNLRAMEYQWNDLFFKLTGTPARTWEDYNKRTTYFKAEECLKLGLIDKII